MNKKLAVTVALVGALAMSACSPGSEPTQSVTSPQGTEQSGAGGSLYVLNTGTVETWDPQRNTAAGVFAFGVRTVWRTLTTEEPGTGKLVGDLATDIGTPSEDGKTWTFTMRDDAFWQDGQAVTCEDVKYGISRTFATDQITGGSTYAIRFLDIPKTDDGGSAYKGPYTDEGREHFDKAITCEGSTITFNLANPQFDFNQTLSTSGFVAYREDQDQGARSTHAIFSSGPYMLDDEWDSGAGGKFVRNPHWVAADHDVRQANPDEIIIEEGLSDDAPIHRIIADSGRDAQAITQIPATPSQQPLILGDQSLLDRTLFVERTGIDFLQPNYRSDTMSNPVIRQALAMSTDREGYAQALGGLELFTPTFSVLHHNLEASSDESPFGEPLGGDPAAAKALLEDANISLPITIEVAYRKTATSDKSMAALAQGWNAAGFDVQLRGIADNYFTVAANAASADLYDVFWNTWGTAWPSASTIIPNLFDSRTNLSEAGSRLDFGYFDDDEVNAQMDAAALIEDDSERERAWGEVSLTIVRDGGYIALTEQLALLPTGSKVDLGNGTKGLRGQIDLAEISIKQ